MAANIHPSTADLPSTKHQEPESFIRQRYRQGLNVAKFVGIVIAVVAAVRVATRLATVVLVGGIAWVAYKIFFAPGASDAKQNPKR